MSYLVAIKFDDPEEAGQVRETLRNVQKQGMLSLDDSAVVVKDAEGKIHVKNEMDRGTKVGALGGGALGLLIAGIFAPLGGIIIGALGGGLVGSLMDMGVSGKFVKEVGEALEPNTSAIFFIVREAQPDAAIAALRQYEGEVFQTSLPPEAEEALRDALKKRPQ